MIPFRRAAATLLLSAVVLSLVVAGAPQPAAAAPAKINGSGSTYVALAMQQWVADAQTRGLDVNYLPTGSPDGLTSFAGSLTDFAGTEAEFSALGAPPNRSFQYIPSVAGAVAVMYNVVDKAGRKVDYLRLSMRTVARIFMGDIARWCDPAITTDNLGLELPCEPITVVYRSGQSGTHTGTPSSMKAPGTGSAAPAAWSARMSLSPRLATCVFPPSRRRSAAQPG